MTLKSQLKTINRETTPENKRKADPEDKSYLPSPSQTPLNTKKTKCNNGLNEKITEVKTKKTSKDNIADGPPQNAKRSGKDLQIPFIMKHPKYFTNMDPKQHQFSNKGKIHKLIDKEGHEVSFLLAGVISTGYLGKYGNWNEEYDKTLDRARFSVLLQAIDGYELEHEDMVIKMRELETQKFGVGKDFTAEDKQLAVKGGNRILLKRKIWRFADDLNKIKTVKDDENRTLWEDANRSKKEPNFYPNGAYDYNGMSFILH